MMKRQRESNGRRLSSAAYLTLPFFNYVLFGDDDSIFSTAQDDPFFEEFFDDVPHHAQQLSNYEAEELSTDDEREARGYSWDWETNSWVAKKARPTMKDIAPERDAGAESSSKAEARDDDIEADDETADTPSVSVTEIEEHVYLSQYAHLPMLDTGFLTTFDDDDEDDVF
eukprot:TRINITY_DN33183_c0_g1_i2.p1 TRINITY_DN33183_c0_g1~~TRINITY_DN33183_c0_g1_i2.p1  ORF type:complete len:170 (-),score=36.83 TRINITY_DN33183_c0_g1_i2:279-788(-)